MDMTPQNGMRSIVDDLMDGIRDVDNSRDEKVIARRHSITARTMRDLDFSDAEIIEHFGYMPKEL